MIDRILGLANKSLLLFDNAIQKLFTVILTPAGEYYTANNSVIAYNYKNGVSFHKTTGGSTLQVGDFPVTDAEWHTTVLSNAYSEPPSVILGPASYNNHTIPMTNCVRLVKISSLDFHPEPWDYLNNPVMEEPENVSLLTLQPGKHNLGSLSADAGNLSGITSEWKQVPFSETFDTIAVVFCTQITTNPPFPTTVPESGGIDLHRVSN